MCSPTDDTHSESIVQFIVVCSSPKAKTLSKPEPVQAGIKLCPQGMDRFYCSVQKVHKKSRALLCMSHKIAYLTNCIFFFFFRY